MTSDYDYYANKDPTKLYVSKRFPGGSRIASEVVDSIDLYTHAIEHKEVVLKVTNGGRHELRAKLLEVAREVFVLSIQRWNVQRGHPLERHAVSFVGHDMFRLVDFLEEVRQLHFKDENKVNVRRGDLRLVEASDPDIKRVLECQPGLIAQLARSEVTEEDVVALGYRKKQLLHFERLLANPDYLRAERAKVPGGGVEALWQRFFESNPWIFGYGLSYLFLHSLDGAKLEQVVRGYSIASSGKRVDALMKTTGLIQSLCFVEIKRHDTDLLEESHYRPGVWQPSYELTGAVAQIQETVRAAAETIRGRFDRDDLDGIPTGEDLFNVQPRSFVVAGSLGEFQTERGTNARRFKAFEVYRRSLVAPEIITFDELFHRAKYIVGQAEG